MKTWIRAFAFAAMAAALPALAVVMPMRIPFQGKLIDPATNSPKNGSFSMVFKLYTVPTGGAALFTETQTVNVVNGVFSVQIGTITYLDADLLSGASAYLGVTVGADAEMAPRQPLSMSPYAYTALQLVSDKNIRVNSGVAYSTFTTAGNWQFPFGVTAGSATITDNVFTVGTSSFTVGGGSATVAYRLTAGSFVGDGSGLTNLPSAEGNTFISSKTIKGELFLTSPNQIKASSATFTYGVVGATATFSIMTATNVGTYSVVTSSGIDMGLGTLLLEPDSRGIDATGTGIVATTATFSIMTATNVGTFSVILSSGIDMAGGTLDVTGSRGINATGTGIVATTATFMTVVSTNVGTYGITTSSGISMLGGTLTLDQASRGLDATGTGVTASTANFTSVSTYSIVSSSGIYLQRGALFLASASNGIDARSSSVTARNFYGNGAGITNIRATISTFTALGTLTATTGTEVVVASAPINPSLTSSRILIQGAATVRNGANTSTVSTLRVRQAVGSVCTTASTQIGNVSGPTTPATINIANIVPFLSVDAPNSISQVWYCLTVTPTGGTTFISSRTLVLTEAQ